MAFDVSNFISYMQRRVGGKKSDRLARHYAIMAGIACLMPLFALTTHSLFRGMQSYRIEKYVVRDGLYYNHFRHG